MFWISVLFYRSVEVILTANSCFIVKQVWLHTITKKCAEIEIILAAREFSDAAQKLILGALGMREAQTGLR